MTDAVDAVDTVDAVDAADAVDAIDAVDAVDGGGGDCSTSFLGFACACWNLLWWQYYLSCCGGCINLASCGSCSS